MLFLHFLLVSSLFCCLAQEGETTLPQETTTDLAERRLPDLDDSTFVGKIRSFIRELGECQASNKELVEEISNIRENIEKRFTEVQSSVTQLSGEFEDHKNDVFWTQFVASLAESISALKVTVASNADQITSVKEYVERNDRITSVEDVVNMNQEKISKIEASVNLMVKGLSNLKVDISRVEDKVENLDEKVESIGQSVLKVNSAVESNSAQISDLSEDVFSIKNSKSWTVIQRRGDFGLPRENFDRDWADYKHGFGNPMKEFWIGNDYIHNLTKSGDMKLRVELEAHDGSLALAEYENFSVENESQGYRLNIGRYYTGNAGDCMSSSHILNGMKFTTRDRDNDKNGGNCAQKYKGGWWFNNCFHAHLNGVYCAEQGAKEAQGIVWRTWLGWKTLKSSTMKIRSNKF